MGRTKPEDTNKFVGSGFPDMAPVVGGRNFVPDPSGGVAGPDPYEVLAEVAEKNAADVPPERHPEIHSLSFRVDVGEEARLPLPEGVAFHDVVSVERVNGSLVEVWYWRG